MSGDGSTTTGKAAGATGMYTVTLSRPAIVRVGGLRPMTEHWAYDHRDDALAELGLILERVPPGTELVLRDPEGLDLLRVARTA